MESLCVYTTVSSWRYSSVAATHETRSLPSRTKLYACNKETKKIQRNRGLVRDRAIGRDILELKEKQGFEEGRAGPVIYAAVRCSGKPTQSEQSSKSAWLATVSKAVVSFLHHRHHLPSSSILTKVGCT